MVVDGDGEHALGVHLADHIIVQHLADLGRRRHSVASLDERGLRLFAMMSLQSSTHSSQMNTVGPAMSFLTSCCDLPQKEQ
jgi:hypothetical protein